MARAEEKDEFTEEDATGSLEPEFTRAIRRRFDDRHSRSFMMPLTHAAVWLDHYKAHLLQLDDGTAYDVGEAAKHHRALEGCLTHGKLFLRPNA